MRERIMLDGFKYTFTVRIVTTRANCNKVRQILEENLYEYVSEEVPFKNWIKMFIKANSIASLYQLNRLLREDKTLILKIK